MNEDEIPARKHSDARESSEETYKDLKNLEMEFTNDGMAMAWNRNFNLWGLETWDYGLDLEVKKIGTKKTKWDFLKEQRGQEKKMAAFERRKIFVCDRLG